MRFRLGAALPIFAAMWMGTAPAGAETPVIYTDEGRALFTFSVPDFWVVRTGGPREIEDTELGDTRAVSRVMGVRPISDDNVWIGFVSPSQVSSVAGGIDYLRDIDKFLVEDPTVSETSDMRVGGLPAQVIRGTGTRDGRGVNFTATVIDLPRDRVAVAVAVLRNGADPAFVDDLNAVFESFRPAR